MQNIHCITCKHYLSDLSCMAFLQRIPDEIILGANDHTSVQEGQNGSFVYQPRSEGKIKNDWTEVPRVPAGNPGGGQWSDGFLPAQSIEEAQTRITKAIGGGIVDLGRMGKPEFNTVLEIFEKEGVRLSKVATYGSKDFGGRYRHMNAFFDPNTLEVFINLQG